MVRICRYEMGADIAGKQESSKYSMWITVHPAVGQSKVDQQVMVVDIQ